MCAGPAAALLLANPGSHQVARTAHEKVCLNAVSQDYYELHRFFSQECKVRIDARSTIDSLATCNSMLRRIDEFFRCDEKLLILVVLSHGEKETGGCKMHDGDIEFADVIELWCQYRVYDCNRMLFILIDCCYSGKWVELAADLCLPNVVVQAACSSKRRTSDAFDGTFTNHWIDVQKRVSPRNNIPLLKWRGPTAYQPHNLRLPEIGENLLVLVSHPQVIRSPSASPHQVVQWLRELQSLYMAKPHQTRKPLHSAGSTILSSIENVHGLEKFARMADQSRDLVENFSAVNGIRNQGYLGEIREVHAEAGEVLTETLFRLFPPSLLTVVRMTTLYFMRCLKVLFHSDEEFELMQASIMKFSGLHDPVLISPEQRLRHIVAKELITSVALASFPVFIYDSITNWFVPHGSKAIADRFFWQLALGQLLRYWPLNLPIDEWAIRGFHQRYNRFILAVATGIIQRRQGSQAHEVDYAVHSCHDAKHAKIIVEQFLVDACHAHDMVTNLSKRSSTGTIRRLCCAKRQKTDASIAIRN